MIKQAFHQEDSLEDAEEMEEDDDEESASPRDVGHNIYILAHQVPKDAMLIDWLINPVWRFFGNKSHLALDRNPRPGYTTLLLQLIPGDI